MSWEAEPHYPLLAHHWSSALDPDGGSPAAAIARARDALGRAGEQAFASYANREAVQFFTDALRLGGSDARWQRQLGEAHFRLGDAGAAVEHLQKALGLLGRPVPVAARVSPWDSSASWASRFFTGSGWPALGTLAWPRRSPPPGPTSCSGSSGS